ncbi:MAG: glutamate racemase [Ignavibacteriales bacterium]|nr:glutamate racemase [Ignavibacteriales bacterium]
MIDLRKPIGVFDSGIGGLTVVKRLVEKLPNERFVYFGDTARVPYGAKSNETVIEYALQDARFLLSRNVKAIVVACNSASSVAIPALRAAFDVPVVGVIEPGARYAARRAPGGKIGVVGTRATIDNRAYSRALASVNPDVKIFEKACPLFVPLAEEGWIDEEVTRLVAEKYLAEFREKELDALILGCTHYPLLAAPIQAAVGENVALVDSGVAAAEATAQELTTLGLRSDFEGEGEREFFVSDVPTKFKEVAERFLGREIEKIRKVDLETLRRR